MAMAIEIEAVSRVFVESGQRIHALREVSFTVGEGQVMGLLGANGAGKTTLTKILSTLLLPTSGAARVLGADVVRDAAVVRGWQSVVLGGERGLYGQLTAHENLRFFGMLGGLSRRALLSRLYPALEEVGLAAVAGRRVSTFSKGMRQRLHIAIGMITSPRVLLLDEPTVGLDPVEAARLRTAIAALRDQGVSILLTSHYLRDIEELADRVVLLDAGAVVCEMSVAEFSASVGHVATVRVHGGGAAPDPRRWPGLAGAAVDIAPRDDGWTASIRLPEWTSEVFEALGRVLAASEVRDVEIEQANLETAYLSLEAGKS
ncbi:ABC transporter ATP-binding protein [Streptomyces sp. MI02-7b]|uniref:ABC transporter ATP-binding protein n=1 Tax=Streptomyces sp. MI02-7b TaxID=462941 RepID=UPI0029B5D470|nr:ABC transporter ATP-binding protein [Streptomyces sp. MI02-7b]MDX3078368.1 ABC transporter ATP-binding protein [Streptomyces sp. MI02-7b]